MNESELLHVARESDVNEWELVHLIKLDVNERELVHLKGIACE